MQNQHLIRRILHFGAFHWRIGWASSLLCANKTQLIMEFNAALTVWVHIIAGTITLLTGPVAIFYHFKQVRLHRLFGQIFFYAMLVVCFSSAFAWFRKPSSLFYQFLLGIAIIVLGGIFRGVRAIWLMKGARVNWFDWAYTALLTVAGLIMMERVGFSYQHTGQVAMSILFGVFGFGALSDAWKNFKVFRRPSQLDGIDWMKLHLESMVGAFIASTTAFTVNAAPFLPWYLQWFGPTIALVPVIIGFQRKLDKMRKGPISA